MNEESKKDDLQPTIQKNKIRSWHLVLSLYGKQMERNGNSADLNFMGSTSLCNVTAATKVKVTCSLKESCDKPI